MANSRRCSLISLPKNKMASYLRSFCRCKKEYSLWLEGRKTWLKEGFFMHSLLISLEVAKDQAEDRLITISRILIIIHSE